MLTPSAHSQAPRMHFIDGLRAAAMLAVLLCHSFLYAGISTLDVPFGAHIVNVAGVLRYGYIGVNLFLLLSGFCLYWPFVKGGSRAEPTLAQYAFRRCRRILPPYYVALCLFGGLGLLQVFTHRQIYHHGLDAHYMADWFAWHALMAHNLSTAHVLALDAPLWSLALEFQLYILFPILVEAYRRWSKRGVLLTVLVLSSLYRAVLPPASDMDAETPFVLVNSVFGRCFEFALGMYVADLLSRWPQGQRSPVRALDYALGAAVIAAGFWKADVFVDSSWGVLFAALVLAASRVSGPIWRLLSHRALVRVGIFSYSVYLIHQPIIMGVGSKLDRLHLPHLVHWAIVLAVLLPVLIGAGYVYHLLFEKPFMSSSQKPKPPSGGDPAASAPLLTAPDASRSLSFRE